MFSFLPRSLVLAVLLAAPVIGEPQLPHPADGFVSTQPLGALVAPGGTTFRVFAPTAKSVTLNLYAGATGPGEHVPMRRNPDGTWEHARPQDLTGRYYTYTATGDDKGFGHEVIDPYARCVTNYNGRGIVLKPGVPSTLRPTATLMESAVRAGSGPPYAKSPALRREDAIIYELHLRDFSADAAANYKHRGKYLSLTEPAVKVKDVSAGLQHLVDLGVNTVQILPLTEFQTDETQDQYGWGYDSVHFNSPDGWYATRRDDATRVTELRAMIDALHSRGIRVIMDMVYNHTMEDRLHDRVYSFEGLVPGYYYRRKPDGGYYNGSGVGNEFRSEAPMARRFILDSARLWVDEYGVDGFRFDLMGLIDEETMNLMTAELAPRGVFIYGEPWAAGTTPIRVTGKGAQKGKGYSVFNDDFRDALKGHVFTPTAGGFIQLGTGTEAVRRGIAGSVQSFAATPGEAINYVECHDNHTLWDRLTLSAPSATEAEREQMDRMAAAILFTSQGVPFIQAGQEFRRTKGGEDNSYNLGDSVNAIRWDDKIRHADMYNYYRGLIHLRSQHAMFRYGKPEFDATPEGVIAYTLHAAPPAGQVGLETKARVARPTAPAQTASDSWSRARVLINATAKTTQFSVPEGADWHLFVDGERAGTQPLQNMDDTTVSVPPRSVWVLGELR